MEIKKFENFDLVPKGWVNVKIDNQIGVRLRKYVKSLDAFLISVGSMRPSDKLDLFKKIDALSNADQLITKNTKVGIQAKLSIVTILQYLNEIKYNFNPSSSGFLMEELIAALVHAKVKNDYSPYDLIGRKSKISAEGLSYQIKFYDKNSSCDIDFPEETSKRCDYYVIALKDNLTISVSIFDGKHENDSSYICKFAKPKGYGPKKTKFGISPDRRDQTDIFRFIEPKKEGGIRKRYITLDPSESRYNDFQFTRKIDLSKIDSLIKSCGDNIQKSIKNLFDNISALEYHSESILTGYEYDLKDVTIDLAKQKADEAIENISKEIEGLSTMIK
jgi:hypothetical protein